MNKKFVILISLVLIASVGLVGCAKKAANSAEAIEQTKTMKTVEEKVNYLVGQANAFISSKEFDQAIRTAQYILSNLDKESAAAESIIEKAKAEMAKAAQAAMDDAKKKMGF